MHRFSIFVKIPPSSRLRDFGLFQLIFPLYSEGWSAERSTSSRQRILTITVALPALSVPREKDSVPQVLQKRCEMSFVLKRYSVSASSPESSANCSSGTNASMNPFFEQCEQLQVIGCERSASTSYRTALQWHPPVYFIRFFFVDRACLRQDSFFSPYLITDSLTQEGAHPLQDTEKKLH